MRRRDAVACVAEGIVHIAGLERAEGRQVGRRDVYWSAPRIFNRDLGPTRKEQSEALGRLPNRASVVRERIADAWRRAAAATAEGDPSVARRAEVAQRLAKGADQLTSGPAAVSYTH